MNLSQRLRDHGRPPLIVPACIGGVLALLVSGMYLILR